MALKFFQFYTFDLFHFLPETKEIKNIFQIKHILFPTYPFFVYSILQSLYIQVHDTIECLHILCMVVLNISLYMILNQLLLNDFLLLICFLVLCLDEKFLIYACFLFPLIIEMRINEFYFLLNMFFYRELFHINSHRINQILMMLFRLLRHYVKIN